MSQLSYGDNTPTDNSSIHTELAVFNEPVIQQDCNFDYQLPTALMFQNHDPDPAFEYVVQDVSQPDIFIEEDTLIPLEGNEIWEDQRNLNNWLNAPDSKSIYLMYHVETGLTEWTMYEILQQSNVSTPNISCLRDKIHLFMSGQMILQYNSNTEAISAANVILRLKTRCPLRFKAFRMTQVFSFPENYSFRPLQYSFEDTYFTNLELPVMFTNFVWFAKPLTFNSKYYSIQVPGCVLGEQLQFEWDIFYYYDTDRSRFLYCMPNGRKIKITSLGNMPQRYHHRQHIIQNSTRRFYEVPIFNPETSYFISQLPEYVNQDLLRHVVQDQSRKTYVSLNHLSPLARKLAVNRLRAINNLS